MLTSKIDDDWLVGYLESNVMHQGLFPSSFVEIIVALKEQPNNVPVHVLICCGVRLTKCSQVTFHMTPIVVISFKLLCTCSS